MFKSVRGTKDIFPPEVIRWQNLEETIRKVMKNYNYGEIRTPIFEETSLFARGIGDETDIVEKEMYTFADKSQNSLTLKPEMTAAVVRAYVQHNFGESRPVNKFYYVSPMFRQERPQAGRLRQFHQVGAEIFGTNSYLADCELIILAEDLLSKLGVRNLNLYLNSVGCPKCRPVYIERLKKYFLKIESSLSEDSRNRLKKNPLRILDSKDEKDIHLKEDAPSILDNLCDECGEHFSKVKKFLVGNKISFKINPNLVRGLDYYTKTAFEFTSTDLGAQDAICGGGRYDLLVSQLGGKETPGVGWACGIERILLASQKYEERINESLDCYFCLLGDSPKSTVYNLISELRKENISCDCDMLDRSLKAQMREANRLNAKFVIIIGQEEFEKNVAVCKNLATGEQQIVVTNEVKNYLKKNLIL